MLAKRLCADELDREVAHCNCEHDPLHRGAPSLLDADLDNAPGHDRAGQKLEEAGSPWQREAAEDGDEGEAVNVHERRASRGRQIRVHQRQGHGCEQEQDELDVVDLW